MSAIRYDETDMPDGAIRRVTALHAETRNELVRADAKATTLLCTVALLLGVLAAGAIAGHWSLPRSDLVSWLLGCAAVLMLGGEAVIYLAVIPRTGHPPDRDSLRYFGHVIQFESRDAFARSLRTADTEPERTIDETWVLAARADRKLRLLRRGLTLIAASVMVSVLSALVDLVSS